jgi:cyanophycin synthetase
MGRGVFANIGNPDVLRDLVLHVREKLNYKNVILEKHFSGDDYRIYVIEDRVIAVMKRVPANVTGDGIKSIIDLIKEKNDLRKKNPYLGKKPIIIDLELKQNLGKSGYTLESIPSNNEVVFLREKCNASAGGDSIDMTGQLAPQIEEMAIAALRATGLVQGGVDLIVNPSSDNAVVIEVNSTAELGIHLFPWQGKARDIPAAIVDYYFPETKGKYVSDRAQYFDLSDVMSPIISRSAFMVEVMPPISGKVYAIKYIISGKVHGIGYRQWIKKKALDQKLHGYANNLNNGKVEVVVAGNDQEAVNQFIDICREGPRKARVDNVTFEEYLGPVQIGFHVQDRKDYDELRKILKKDINSHQICIAELRENQHKLEEIKRKHRNLRRKYKVIKNSRSWRYTELIRKTFSKLHRRK